MDHTTNERIGTAPRVTITREDRSDPRPESSHALVRKVDRKGTLLARMRNWLIRAIAKPI